MSNLFKSLRSHAPNRRIYLDYASATPIDRRALAAMKVFSSFRYANASSLYKEGVAAREALAGLREKAASFLHAHADEIVFTSGGTEANALAIEGAGRAARRAGLVSATGKLHLIISSIEHSSVMSLADMLESHGVEVTRLAVDASGIVSLDELKKALKPETFMVSIMAVNNEIGSVQPLRDVAKAIRRVRESFAASSARVADPKLARYPLFHTDAAQAALYEDLNVERLGVDLLTLDAGKVYGPRGIGALYIRRGTLIEPVLYGGGQERGLRSGTENLPAIAGFATALELAAQGREAETVRVAALRDSFSAGLQALRPDIKANGPLGGSQSVLAAPHILNISIPGIDNELLLFQLDAAGIACSTKSSCLRDVDESYVLTAIGADSRTALRFSFGRWTKRADVARALKAISAVL